MVAFLTCNCVKNPLLILRWVRWPHVWLLVSYCAWFSPVYVSTITNNHTLRSVHLMRFSHGREVTNNHTLTDKCAFHQIQPSLIATHCGVVKFNHNTEMHVTNNHTLVHFTKFNHGGEAFCVHFTQLNRGREVTNN